MTETTENAWKETVRDIFDELHFGKDNLFEGQSRLARRIAHLIDERHHDYFCGRHLLDNAGVLNCRKPPGHD